MTFLQEMAMESAAAVVRRWNPLPLGVQGVADFPSGSLVWTQLGYRGLCFPFAVRGAPLAS